MAPSPNVQTDHDQRLRAVEVESVKLAASIEAVRVGYVVMDEKLDDLKACVTDLKTVLVSNHEKLEVRLGALEKTKDKLDTLKGAAKWALGPVLVVGGAVLAKFGDHLFAWFTS
jgi:hypothetical protein